MDRGFCKIVLFYVYLVFYTLTSGNKAITVTDDFTSSYRPRNEMDFAEAVWLAGDSFRLWTNMNTDENINLAETSVLSLI